MVVEPNVVCLLIDTLVGDKGASLVDVTVNSPPAVPIHNLEAGAKHLITFT